MPKPLLPNNHQFRGKVGWKSPSNIALVKYWGKRPVQLPANPSISFTLSEAYTETIVTYMPRQKNSWISFLFEGKEEPSFTARISKYFSSLLSIMPFLNQLSFNIESVNSFPHSSGIASSASSMSALALCLCEIENNLYATPHNEEVLLNKASLIARLGSGSASRSLYKGISAWGKSPYISNSSDEYAIPFTGVHSIFESFHDDIIIVSDEKKSVSSSAGHALMNTNIFAETRYNQADRHMKLLVGSLKNGDLKTFGKIVEDEALTLHALMMCSDPSYILMEPGTISIIKEIRKFRERSGLPVFFTLDAGPNVHVLYPDHIAPQVKMFMDSNLLSFAHNARVIEDHVGMGPNKII